MTPEELARTQLIQLQTYAQAQQPNPLQLYQNLLMQNMKAFNQFTMAATPMLWQAPSVISPPKISVEPPKVGEIIAWRTWKVRYGFLTSLAVNEIWAPGHAMTGSPEGLGNSGLPGIYAWKESRHAIRHMMESEGTLVCGSVEMWGDVIEHELGYRASFAKPLTLDWVHGLKGFMARRRGNAVLAELRLIYGIEPKK